MIVHMHVLLVTGITANFFNMLLNCSKILCLSKSFIHWSHMHRILAPMLTSICFVIVSCFCNNFISATYSSSLHLKWLLNKYICVIHIFDFILRYLRLTKYSYDYYLFLACLETMFFIQDMQLHTLHIPWAHLWYKVSIYNWTVHQKE